jgi:PTH1 family peptidyl-tRNA hydrolase
MNLSGKSVQACASFFKIAPKDIVIISDDIDMEFGKIRFRETGSQGGHNGIGSIIEVL